jgi:hypothetical protein
VHLDTVAVSGMNQYKVRPAALVSTAVPPIVAVIMVDPDELAAGLLAAPAAAALVAPAAGVLLVELDELAELPHAAMASTAAPRPAVVSIFRIGRYLLTPCLISNRDHVCED